MIKSSSHSIKFANTQKLSNLNLFLNEYRRVGQSIINFIWENGYGDFIPKKDQLNLPKYLDYSKFPIKTSLSARALSSLATQIAGVLGAATKKRRKCLWMLEKLKSEGKSTSHLDKKLAKNYKLVKPNFLNNSAELSSKCMDIQVVAEGGYFNYFVCLRSIGKSFGKILIPVKATSVSNKWLKQGVLMNSVLVGTKNLCLRFKVEKEPKIDREGKIVGIDQGLKTVATFSDGQTTPDIDCHGHSFESILDKLSRKKKGSRAFVKAQSHRKNFINWSLNKIDFSNFKEARLEKIWNIRYKSKSSRKMSHWTNTLIRDKIKSLAQEAEVPLIEQDSSYRSQRCSSCGSVRKANRKGKIYTCKHCGFTCDADLNASLNHSIDLPEIHFTLRSQKLNLGNGFYWLRQGLFTFDGQEIRVPDSLEKDNFL